MADTKVADIEIEGVEIDASGGPISAIGGLLNELIPKVATALGADEADMAAALTLYLATSALAVKGYDREDALKLMVDGGTAALDHVLGKLPGAIKQADEDGVAVPAMARVAARRAEGHADA